MQLTAWHLTQPEAGWWAVTPLRLGLSLAVTVAFSGLGRLIRGVTISGAIAGGVVCFVLFASIGPGGFVALLALFVVTWVATRLGRARKLRLGTAERREGRSASQVFANLAVATLCGVGHALQGSPIWIVAMAAAMAEAAADTVSSEAGQVLSERARLVTTFEQVPAGTDGGISLAGTLAGLTAALAVAAVCVWAALIGTGWMWLVMAAGVVGMLADSLLGALLERPGRLSNDTVNFAGTAIAAALAAGYLALWG